MKKSAFTLIELLVVIAIIAILAAILFPVFAQAKTAAKASSSLSSVKQLALGLHIYSADADDATVFEYGYGTAADPNQYHNDTTWVGRISPYVKNRGIFFDTFLGDPKEEGTLPNGTKVFLDPFYGAGYEYTWQWVSTFALNTDGFSRAWTGTGCTAINWSGAGNPRTMTSFEDPAARLAVAPNRYANLNWGWMRFYAIDASWPTSDRYASGFDWYQLIWDARRQYPGPRFVGGMADGHASKFGREKFVHYYADNPAASDAQTYNQYCAQMDSRNLWKFWGKPWSSE